MPRQRTTASFADELPRLLAERGLSLRALAAQSGVDPGFLSRVVRSTDYKSPSVDLCRSVALALGLPVDYFAEYRLGTLVERIKADPQLRDRLYQRHVGRTP